MTREQEIKAAEARGFRQGIEAAQGAVTGLRPAIGTGSMIVVLEALRKIALSTPADAPAPDEQGFGRCASLCAMPPNHRGGCVDAYGDRLSAPLPRPDEDGECRRCGGAGRVLGGPSSTCEGRAPKAKEGSDG